MNTEIFYKMFSDRYYSAIPVVRPHDGEIINKFIFKLNNDFVVNLNNRIGKNLRN